MKPTDNQRTIGMRERHQPTAEEMQLLGSLASHAANAINNAQLYREATRQAQRMSALADLGRLLSETLDLGVRSSGQEPLDLGLDLDVEREDSGEVPPSDRDEEDLLLGHLGERGSEHRLTEAALEVRDRGHREAPIRDE